MDQVFAQMNHTRSFLGESYLYYMLRTPQLQDAAQEEFEELVTWLDTHEKEREELEYFFAKIGKTGRNSVFDYVYNLAEADSGSNLVHFGMIAMILGAVGLLLASPESGILLLLAAMGVSIGTYEHYKRPVAPYVTSCIAIQKVLDAAVQIGKMGVWKLPEKEMCIRDRLSFLHDHCPSRIFHSCCVSAAILSGCAPCASRNPRSRNPQLTAMQSIPAFAAVRISTSESPT